MWYKLFSASCRASIMPFIILAGVLFLVPLIKKKKKCFPCILLYFKVYFFTTIVPKILILPNSIITNHSPGYRLGVWLLFCAGNSSIFIKGTTPKWIYLLSKIFPKCLFIPVRIVFLIKNILVSNSKSGLLLLQFLMIHITCFCLKEN